MKPYYDEDGITIFHADCRDMLHAFNGSAVVTDPPYGIDYRSGYEGTVSRSIVGDDTTELRDWLLSQWLPRPIATFATWRCVPPSRPRGCLVWEKAAGGMGDLSFPWAPNFEMIWIFGEGWSGHRGSSVLTGETVVTWNTGSAARLHPHQKPESVLRQIIEKAPTGVILDPFMGSGTTLRAAKDLGRRAVGIDIEERYCEIAAKRLRQRVLPLEMADGR